MKPVSAGPGDSDSGDDGRHPPRKNTLSSPNYLSLRAWRGDRQTMLMVASIVWHVGEMGRWTRGMESLRGWLGDAGLRGWESETSSHARTWNTRSNSDSVASAYNRPMTIGNKQRIGIFRHAPPVYNLREIDNIGILMVTISVISPAKSK